MGQDLEVTFLSVSASRGKLRFSLVQNLLCGHGVAKDGGMAEYCRAQRVKMHLGDTVDYQGIAYRVEAITSYRLQGRTLRLARLVAAGEVRYLDLPGSDIEDRILLLAEIPSFDIATPPPAIIYHGGESYLLKLSGTARIESTDAARGGVESECALSRYRAAGGRALQIEAWPDGVRMLAGATVRQSMLEIRPATPQGG
ncbi:MAG: DUF4178 domain-containing protein [Deltaproteobacteria bacterium]|nr:DUF4178 domain-containing protein [Deltaproteobacteria bacterium]